MEFNEANEELAVTNRKAATLSQTKHFVAFCHSCSAIKPFGIELPGKFVSVFRCSL